MAPVVAKLPVVGNASTYSIAQMNQMGDILAHSFDRNPASLNSMLGSLGKNDPVYWQGNIFQELGKQPQLWLKTARNVLPVSEIAKIESTMKGSTRVAGELQTPANFQKIPSFLIKFLLDLAIPNVVKSNAKTGISLYKATYWSIDPYGNAAELNGLVIKPNNVKPIGNIVSLHSSGTGIPSEPDIKTIYAIKMASLGYDVLVPDNYDVNSPAGKAPEPYLWVYPTAIGVVDMMNALKNEVESNKDPMLMGGSQGAHTAIATLNYLNDLGKSANVRAAEGPYSPEDMFTTYAALIAGRAQANDPWISETKNNRSLLVPYLKLAMEVSNYYGITSIPIEQAFNADNSMSPTFANQYLAGNYAAFVHYLESNSMLHQVPSAGFLGNVTLWGFSQDALVSEQNTAELHAAWQAAGMGDRLKTGDCRENSFFTKIAMTVIKATHKPMLSHILCSLYMADDISAELAK